MFKCKQLSKSSYVHTFNLVFSLIMIWLFLHCMFCCVPFMFMQDGTLRWIFVWFCVSLFNHFLRSVILQLSFSWNPGTGGQITTKHGKTQKNKKIKNKKPLQNERMLGEIYFLPISYIHRHTRIHTHIGYILYLYIGIQITWLLDRISVSVCSHWAKSINVFTHTQSHSNVQKQYVMLPSESCEATHCSQWSMRKSTTRATTTVTSTRKKKKKVTKREWEETTGKKVYIMKFCAK